MPKTSHKQARQLKPNNIKGFKNALSMVDWSFVSEDDDLENVYTKFLNKTPVLINIHCPLKAIKVSKRKTPRKPWVTIGLLNSIRTKDKIYIKYIGLTKPTSENKINYTKYRNLLNNLLRASKKSHITSEIESNKFNMKETWKTLNSLLGRNNQTKLPDFFKDNNGNKITDSIDIADHFTDFFTNIGTRLAEKMANPDSEYISQ